MKLTLSTDRLILRPFNEDDAYDMFHGWTSDKEVTTYLTWNPHNDINETKALLDLWIKQYEKPERINFAITLKEDNSLIGGIDVVGYLEGVPVLGYVLNRKYWNKGYMSEAAYKVIDYLFSIGHTEIRIDAVVENIGSNRVIEKCHGFLINTVSEYLEAKKEERIINQYIITKENFYK